MCGFGALAGYLWGGVDRNLSIRTGVITAFRGHADPAARPVHAVVADLLRRRWPTVVRSPRSGRRRPICVADFWITGIDNFTHLLLPTLALILTSIAGYSRYSRSSLLDVMNQDYIRTARAKGLTERTVVMRHAFRNALIPVTTVIALDFGALIGGAVITETVFSWSGMGALFQQAINQVDVNPIMGVFLVTAIAAVVFNVIADLIYSALDPRIRVSA